MYASEIKARQSQVMVKFVLNSKKSVNNLQSPLNSILKDQKNQVLLNKRNNNKFELLKTSKVSKKSSTDLALAGNLSCTVKRGSRRAEVIRKSNKASVIKARSVNSDNSTVCKRIAQHTNSSSAKERVKSDLLIANEQERVDTFVQTNEREILDNLLIVGDFKVMKPSKSIVDEIDKLRKEEETKNLLMAARKFEAHSQKDEQYLDDLTEFLDKSFVTRKPPKLQDNNLVDHQLIASMDELLQNVRSKTESITDIKCRIKCKEQELLKLFDRFQN